MKKVLTIVVLLFFAGSAYADWKGGVWSETDADVKQQVKDDSGYQSATAQQPGIGDSSHPFGQKSFSPGYFEQGDWTNLNSEEIYGSF